MFLKSTSIATRLLLASCVSAVVIVMAIVAFTKLWMIPNMTDQALSNQTSALARSLRDIRANEAMWSDEELSRPETLDSFSHQGEMVVSLFVFKNGGYYRVASTLKKDDGSRAVGTLLDVGSDVDKALRAGKAYSGTASVLGRPFMTTYLPVVLENGKKGAVGVGIDYNSSDPTLAFSRQMDFMVLGVGVVAIVLLGVGLAFAMRVERTHRETEDIFRTTQEGLFLIDHELRLGSQTSQAVSQLLGLDVRPGDNFLELLRPSVSAKTFDTAKEYMELLMRHDVKEKLVASLNPLDCLEISSVRPNGGMETRYLQIRFNRVMKSGKVTHLLGTANNITRQVRLERELKESERRVQDQMAMMVHILQADPRLLQEFLTSASAGLERINESLRDSNATTGMTGAQIDAVFRTAHQLKGDASALQLETVAQSLHGLESSLEELRSATSRKGEDLLPVTVRVKELFSEIRSIHDVINRINQVRGVVSVEPPKPPKDGGEAAGQPLVRQWNAFAQQLAERHGKKAEFLYQGLDLDTLAPRLRESLNSVVNQFVRNALVHGVELPEARKQRGKPEAARLSVYVSDQGDGFLELSFRDDGAGVDLEKIRTAAIRSGHLAPETAAKADARQLTMMIFEPGFSTADVAGEDAGRGIGLDAVKEMIARQGGRIRIGTTRGEYCHFRVRLPMETAANASVMTEPDGGEPVERELVREAA